MNRDRRGLLPGVRRAFGNLAERARTSLSRRPARSLVSVVIPSFNHAPFVAESIRSVLDQSYANLEIIIVDDGSTDGTPDVVRGISDPRIHLEVLPENRGAVTALNMAIARARGEFVCMLSSDDYFLPAKVERQVAFMNEHPDCAATFGLPRFIDERGAPLPSERAFNRDVFSTPIVDDFQGRDDWLRYFFFSGNCLCHPTVMARREIYSRVGLFDSRFANLPDLDMWVRLVFTHKIHVAPDALIAMRMLDNHRNMSAPRPESVRRHASEYYQILKHYRRLPAELFERVFAAELTAHPEWSSLPRSLQLAKIALGVGHPPHRLFAVDTLFEAGAGELDGHYPELYRLTGDTDLFAR